MTAILVITHQNDAHIPFVQRHLTCELITVVPENVTYGTELSFVYQKGKSTVIYDGRKIPTIKSVWWRKPWAQLKENDLPVPASYKKYSYSTMHAHADNLKALFPDAFWLSEYYAIKRAEHKS